jgi:hypothetical protein
MLENTNSLSTKRIEMVAEKDRSAELVLQYIFVLILLKIMG